MGLRDIGSRGGDGQWPGMTDEYPPDARNENASVATGKPIDCLRETENADVGGRQVWFDQSPQLIIQDWFGHSVPPCTLRSIPPVASSG